MNQKNAFDIPKKSSFSAELETYARRSKTQTKVVSKQRKNGIEPMKLHLTNSGKLNPKDRA
jgi:hypothetical protein